MNHADTSILYIYLKSCIIQSDIKHLKYDIGITKYKIHIFYLTDRRLHVRTFMAEMTPFSKSKTCLRVRSLITDKIHIIRIRIV